MLRKCILLIIGFCLPLGSTSAFACMNHLYFNPDEMGFLGGAVVRMAGLAPPKPVFDLQYPAMAKSVIGEESEIVVQYARPFVSKNVRLEVSGTKNVNVLLKEIPLEDREGSITIPYEVLGAGFDTLILTVVGEHKGETVRQAGRIYISARKAEENEAQVTSR